MTSAEDILNRHDAHARLALIHGGTESTEPAAGPVWEAGPVPLHVRPALPTFPTDALPAAIADQVAAVAEFTQTPPDLAGGVALACLATAAGGRVVVEARPGWREPTNLYVAVAAEPGSRKSPVFSAMTAPLVVAEHALVEATRPRIIDAALHARIATARADAAARTAEHSGSADAVADAQAAAMDADAATVPVEPRLIADDATPEATASLLASHGGRIAVLSAEGGIFTTLAGRYSGGIPNLDVFLKGHAGDLLRIDRKGRPAEHIPAPALTLGLAVQPDVLRDIAALPGFRGRGLLARILYAVPDSLVGSRRIGAPAPPNEVTAAYHRTLYGLTLTLADWTDPAVLTLTPDAHTRLLEWEAELEPRLHPESGDLAGIADWAAKLVGATVRLAALIHLAGRLDNAWKTPITASTIDAAIQLARYYLDHALTVFDHMGANPALDCARTIHDWIHRHHPNEFTRRDLFTALKNRRYTTVTDLDPGLELLEAHGHIQQTTPHTSSRGGRPSIRYHVHPESPDTM